jgi:hypothetical protein
LANIQEVTTLWAGGWDDYKIDLDDLIDDTKAGSTDPEIRPDKDGPRYVRLLFVGRYRQQYEGKAARVVQKLGGGD